jgi:hypothetical protein
MANPSSTNPIGTSWRTPDEGFDVAATTFLSLNSIKSYIRTTYRKIGVTSRTQAVLWGFEHGVKPDHHRIDHWRGGP